jgi:hypothetical protein
MKRIHVIGVALLAMFALSAIVASAASAVTFLPAEWLINGEKLAAALAITQEGELNLINTNGGGFGIRVEILCSGILLGTVGPGAADSTTGLQNLAKEAISGTPLTGLALTCTNDAGCTEPKVWAEELPWKTSVDLMEDGAETFFVDLLENGKYYAECLILGIAVSELCTAPVTAIQLTNEAAGVDATFSDAFQELAELKLGECGERPETAIVEGLGTIKPDAGTLTVSE